MSQIKIPPSLVNSATKIGTLYDSYKEDRIFERVWRARKTTEIWIQKLRSGKYNQGQSTLYSSRGYCCLGILGKVCQIDDRHLYGSAYLYQTGSKRVKRIPKAFEAQEVNGFFARLNDGLSLSFEQIADLIEANKP